ncbi:MAG: 50S ribosomal protein L32 [Planctomycetia bacterium]|nr:50S ribosomal protein L32 [Planctomycetia bacterium]
MPNPKRKFSRSRTRKKRTHDRHKLPTLHLAECPRCHQHRRPHRVCGNCGYYDGEPVIKL